VHTWERELPSLCHCLVKAQAVDAILATAMSACRELLGGWWVEVTVLQVNEETSGHARTFARKFCVSGRFLDHSMRNARTFPLPGWPNFRSPPEL
jgi:hypothetical protein